MGRRRKARFFTDGVLLVNKPEGITSHDVVARLRARYGPEKIGHAGTLDPFASGMLVLAFNRTTKLMDLLGTGRKEYLARLSLGAATDTGDPTGEVIKKAAVPELSTEQIERALAALEGPRMQAPPAYSAAKHQGKPLYAYARQGKKVQKPPKPIQIDEARLVEAKDGLITFRVRCSRGTYVRSLAEDLAEDLGTVGHLICLMRTASEPFRLKDAVELEAALDLGPQGLKEAMLDTSRALEHCGVPSLVLDDERVWELRQGRILSRQVLLEAPGGNKAINGPFRVLSLAGELVAVLRWLGPGEMRPGRDYESIRVFPERRSSANNESHTAA